MAAVLAMHVGLLARWPAGAGDRPRAGALQPIQVRQIGGSAEKRVAGIVEAPTQARVEARAEASRGGLVAPPARPVASKPPAPTAAPAEPTIPAGSPATTPAAAAPEAPPAALPAPRPGSRREPRLAGGEPAPVYPTTPLASATLHYAMRRGAASGTASLDWRPAGQQYELTLAGSIGGVEAIGWHSRGGFDDAGVAPERFVVRERGRERLAANFQRDGSATVPTRGRITFSGPSVEWPLPAGAQDRVSWIVQLAAILQARPSLASEGTRISLWVIGARGDADLWTFEARADTAEADSPTPGATERPARGAAGLRLVRDPARPYDLRVEVWPDAAHQHLPARLRFVVDPGGRSTEFELQPAR
jgi:hypothetical protein